MEIKGNEFLEALTQQVRSIDQYDAWAKIPDDELLSKRYIKSKEELKALGTVCAALDEMQLMYIKMVFKAIGVLFEKKTGQMANVLCEMNMHEGFGRIITLCDDIVIVDKTLRDAQRYSFENLEKLAGEMEKLLDKAIKTYQKYRGGE